MEQIKPMSQTLKFMFGSVILGISAVNHPHQIGVGMSREGYGQQVDKEA